MPERHELKCWLKPFAAIRTGEKTFEHRLDDRGYRNGDTLALREWDEDAEAYTGRQEERRVSYILEGGQFGVAPGHVVMALAPVPTEHDAVPADAQDLARWHSLKGSAAAQRAANARRAAEHALKNPDAGPGAALAADRQRAVAQAADDEAAFHYAAADVARRLQPIEDALRAAAEYLEAEADQRSAAGDPGSAYEREPRELADRIHDVLAEATAA